MARRARFWDSQWEDPKLDDEPSQNLSKTTASISKLRGTLNRQIEKVDPVNTSSGASTFSGLEEGFESTGSSHFIFPKRRKHRHMGRRRRGTRAITQIKIVIDQHVEVFDLRKETLIDREGCIRRAEALRGEALAYIKRMDPQASPIVDFEALFAESAPFSMTDFARPPLRSTTRIEPSSTLPGPWDERQIGGSPSDARNPVFSLDSGDSSWANLGYFHFP
jgi:hypothetical protein